MPRPIKIFLVENEPLCISNFTESLFGLKLLHRLLVTQSNDFGEVFDNLTKEMVPDLIMIRDSDNARSVIKYLKNSKPYGKIPVVVVITENTTPDDYGADFYVDSPLEAKTFWKIVARIPNIFLCFVEERPLSR